MSSSGSVLIDSQLVAATEASGVRQNSRALKLPEIKLPGFDGKFENWLEFRNIFEALIHHHVDFKELEKFHYLCTAL